MEYNLFKEKYEKMASQMKSNKNISIIDVVDIFYNLDQEDYLFDQKRLISKYYIPNDYLKLSWEFQFDEFTENGGYYNLKSFLFFLVNPLETSFKDKVSQDDAKLLKEGYRFFDRPNEIDRAAIKITAGKIENKVYFINELNKPQRMTLSYPEYMDKVIEIKGLQHWQYLFIEGLKFKDVQFGLERELGERLKMYEEVFPDEDISEYQKLFEEMK